MAISATTPNNRRRVFIASVRADAGFADQVCALLAESGFDACTDRDDVETASDIVLVLSDASARTDVSAWTSQQATRLGKRLIPVLPAPLRARAPQNFPERSFVRFYVDPALPHSGFFDGQKQLINALSSDGEWALTLTYVVEQAARWRARHDARSLLLHSDALAAALDWRQHTPANAHVPAVVDEYLDACVAARGGIQETVATGHTELRTLNRELKRARGEIARIKREERDQRRRDMQRLTSNLPPPRYDYAPPRRGRQLRFPWLRAGFLLAVGGYVVGFFVSEDVRAKTRSVAAEAATWVETVHQATEPPRHRGVSADDYTPERDAFAGASGANVRDYPLPHATLLTELPARSPLHITGRLNVQGEWWFRVVLADTRIGFVHQNAIAWSRPPAPAATQAVVANVTAVEPAVGARAGRAGAKIRVSPARNARVIVRIARNADVSITGKRLIGSHWWYRVRLDDGREGFARDDVLTAPDGGRLRV